MILFATRSANRDKLNAHCIAGIRASMRETYSHVTRASNSEDIFPTLQDFIEGARQDNSAEALVLLHDDLELRDAKFAAKVRHTFKDPEVAIVGCIGARNVKSLSWWEGSPRFGHTEDNLHGVYDWGFDDEGDVRLGEMILDHEPVNVCDVDTVDGMLLILSPWAIHHLSLIGLGYEGLHGYAEELCFQARAKGKRVVVTRLELKHHSKGGIAGNIDGWNKSDALFRERWVKPPPQTINPFLKGLPSNTRLLGRELPHDEAATLREIERARGVLHGHPLLPGGVHVRGCICDACTVARPTSSDLVRNEGGAIVARGFPGGDVTR